MGRIRIRIGISGWTYAPWRGVFYPERLAHDEELSYASSQFDTIEINGTFYRLQQPSSFARWRDVPPLAQGRTNGLASGAEMQGRDVFVYFDNDAKVRAPVDAASLIERVSSSKTTKPPTR